MKNLAIKAMVIIGVMGLIVSEISISEKILIENLTIMGYTILSLLAAGKMGDMVYKGHVFGFLYQFGIEEKKCKGTFWFPSILFFYAILFTFFITSGAGLPALFYIGVGISNVSFFLVTTKLEECPPIFNMFIKQG